MKRGLTVLMVAGLWLGLSGCAHIIAGVKDLGVTPKDRMVLLKSEVVYFNDAVLAGKIHHALDKVAPEAREKVKNQIRAQSQRERIFEAKIVASDFNEEATEAKVEIMVQYYEIPRYIVLERIEDQLWVFERPGQWKMTKRRFRDPVN